jgi:pimeloyl-ACP methyl ester carboxylesterase/protein-tyrosine phosphatase
MALILLLNAESTDPGLLKKFSNLKSYTTSIGTYPSIRTFYRPHTQADKLPSKPTPLPLLVFIHGLGGSLAQFHPLLTSLINVAPCLGVDLPGCGLSTFSPTSWNHYSLNALAELLGVIIQEHCNGKERQGVVLIGHSMGCSLAALLASVTSPLRIEPRVEVLALIAVCPKASVPSDQQISTYKKLLQIPTPIFNIWRMWDRRGGSESASVERFNMQSRTAVWRRMAWGVLPTKHEDNKFRGGLPGVDVWAGLVIPLFLVAGEADGITPASEIALIRRALGRPDKTSPNASCDQSPEIHGVDQNRNLEGDMPSESNEKRAIHGSTIETITDDSGSYNLSTSRKSSEFSKKRRVLKTSILPAPASHALLYDPATYRTLAGLIQTFLCDHVDSRLSLGWQLQHLTTEGKWDVKNLVKWQTVRPVSEPIAEIFRAMKTLREVDETHSPEIFVRDWQGKIKAVIDISHESPVYDPKGLDDRGIEYHKFPTVSKIPPAPEEVESFNALVDHLRQKPSPTGADQALIGVHCHYGFNRTGFFICCYLIEKERFGVQQAIDEFRTHRPPGIRHEHFLDTLFVRYCLGLKRTPTF